MSGTKNARAQMPFQAWGKQGYTHCPHRKRVLGMGRQQILLLVLWAILVVWHFLVTREPTSIVPEELCQQRGAGWKRGTRERVEAVSFLVKEQFKVRGVETFMGLVMTLEGPVPQ
jgi:uncharacterized membrane protein